MTCKKIQNLLKRKDKTLTIIDNTKKHSASCWDRYGFPATVDQNNMVVSKLDNFVSCKKCYVTYSFNSNSTTQMNKHNCENLTALSSSKNSQTTVSSSFQQTKIDLFTSIRPGSVKLNQTEKKKLKDLLVEWTCMDIRPFSIVNDHGLKCLVQECISLGILYHFHEYSCLYSFLFSLQGLNMEIFMLMKCCSVLIRHHLILQN
jgi:hypothetical protein